ncbi:MAG: flavodoxin family protein [Methanothrix sp.]|nr:MAG: flavodoxin family protein [Methanothrix sp.]
MNILAINGSPRKDWNTATLLNKALEGAASVGAEAQLIHLYDLDFKGCKSCFACKTRGGKSYGHCAQKDGLTPLLKRIENEADAVILGSPIYLGTITGEMHSFMERLMFPYLTYTNPPATLFPRKISSGFIYTMNISEELMKEMGYLQHTKTNEWILSLIFGRAESLFSNDTYQFDDYSKVVADRFDPVQKAKRKQEVFPKDCEKAFEMGARFAKGGIV